MGNSTFLMKWYHFLSIMIRFLENDEKQLFFKYKSFNQNGFHINFGINRIKLECEDFNYFFFNLNTLISLKVT